MDGTKTSKIKKNTIRKSKKDEQHGPHRKTEMKPILVRCWSEQVVHKYLSRSLFSHISF